MSAGEGVESVFRKILSTVTGVELRFQKILSTDAGVESCFRKILSAVAGVESCLRKILSAVGGRDCASKKILRPGDGPFLGLQKNFSATFAPFSEFLIMDKLMLPMFSPRMKEIKGKRCIFDASRQKFVAITPEEWVRQHFVNYLVAYRGYPQSLVANEVSIRLNSTEKRCDTVVYDRYLRPLAIVEYKAPRIELTRTVFEQVARYNMVLHVPFLMLSNGLRHVCCRVDYAEGRYQFLKEIPEYREIESACE